jgi:hypothetical protein
LATGNTFTGAPPHNFFGDGSVGNCSWCLFRKSKPASGKIHAVFKLDGLSAS